MMDLGSEWEGGSGECDKDKGYWFHGTRELSQFERAKAMTPWSDARHADVAFQKSKNPT